MFHLITKAKFYNCLMTIFLILFLRSECLRLGKNSQTPQNVKSTPYNKITLDEIMSKNNELFPETITYSKQVTLHNDSTCTNYSCHPPYGKCIDSTTCQCGDWYMNVPYLSYSHSHICTYRQKSQVVSFILELMFLSGIGHLYASRSVIGLSKLIFSVIIVIVLHFMSSHVSSRSNEDYLNQANQNSSNTPKNKILQYLPYILMAFFFMVQFIDLILIGKNFYLDGYGIPMKEFKFNFE